MPSKLLAISGSPRPGNTEFILSRIYDGIRTEKDYLSLRNYYYSHCRGCMSCRLRPECVIRDDMDKLLPKVRQADILIIGTPNYFDSITGLLKDFLDRTHPFYKQKMIAGKKLIIIGVGGGKIEGTKKCLEGALEGFIKYQQIDLVASYYFQALEADELSQNKATQQEIDEIVSFINK